MKVGVGCIHGQEVAMVRSEAASNGDAPGLTDTAGVGGVVRFAGGAPAGRDVRLSPADSDFHNEEEIL